MKIAQVIDSNVWGEIGPKAFERGIGGREGAMIRLATEWAKLGHEVTNFVSVKKASRFKEGGLRFEDKTVGALGFHEYVPTYLAKPMLRSFPYDAVIAWECPGVFGEEEIMERQKVRLLHMQVAHLEDRGSSEFCTGVVALSKWAQDFLIHDGVENDNWYIRPNGVDISVYPTQDALKDKARKGINLVYSSSPDRGLLHLLQMWPEIRKIDKKAKLKVGYGVKNWTEIVKWSHSKVGEMAVQIDKLMKQPGIIDIGKIGQAKLAKLQLDANIWIYPADTIQATETGCITAIENMAAGNPCIMSDVDCLGSEFNNSSMILPLPFNESYYINQINHLLDSSSGFYQHFQKEGRKFAEERDWSKIAPTWIDLFEENNA